MSRALEWTATAYLIALPCLWWRGIAQDEAQTVALVVGTAGWVALSCGRGPLRVPRLAWAGWGLGGLVAASILVPPVQGFSPLVLWGLVAWLGVWLLVQGAPSAEWITRRVVWLAWLNVGYGFVQWIGWDPIFETSGVTGFFGKRAWLGLLCAVCLPFASWWGRAAIVAFLMLIGSWTGLLASAAWGFHRLWTSSPRRALTWGAIGTLVAGAWGWLHPADVAMRVLPRLVAWEYGIGESVWSLVGYGLGAWEATHRVLQDPAGPWLYSTYLWAWHVGGIALLSPLLWVGWTVWRSPRSQEREALLILAGCLLVQQAWMTPRLIVMTVALLAAWELRRVHAD